MPKFSTPKKDTPSQRSSGPRPEGARFERGRAESSRPEGSRPEGSRPEGSRPESSRPEGSRPGGRASRAPGQGRAGATRFSRPTHSPRSADSGPRNPEREAGIPKEEKGVEQAEIQVDTPLLPGVKPVLELLEANPERVDMVYLRKGRHGAEMDRILDLCRTAKVRFSLLDQGAFSRLYKGQSQGVLARLYDAGFVEVEDLFAQVMDAPLPIIVVLDQVKDPGNAGALARTLYALGGAGLIVPRHNGVYLGAHAAKASAGALEYLPVARAGSISQTLALADKEGFTLYGTAMGPGDTDSPPVHDVFAFSPRLPALLLLGSEEDGLRPGLVKRCHGLIQIPMQRDFDSLNVAQAGAICIAAFLQKHLAGKNR